MGALVDIDANVLLYASDAASPHHATALATVEALALGPEIAYLFWSTVMAYLRVATHPAVFARPLSLACRIRQDYVPARRALWTARTQIELGEVLDPREPPADCNALGFVKRPVDVWRPRR